MKRLVLITREVEQVLGNISVGQTIGFFSVTVNIFTFYDRHEWIAK